MSNIPSFYCPTNIYMGHGSHRKLDELVNQWNIRKLSLLVDPALLKTKVYSLVEDIVGKNNTNFEIYSNNLIPAYGR